MERLDLVFALRVLLRDPDADAFADIVATHQPADIVDAFEDCNLTDLSRLLQTLGVAARAALFPYFPADTQDALLLELPRQQVVDLFEYLPSDDRADLFNRLDEAAKAALLPALTRVEREDILRLASFPEGSVGSVTTSDYVAVNAEMSVAEALATIRASAVDKETVYSIYVVDFERRLIGTLSLRDLVLADVDTPVATLMRREPVFLRAEWPRQKVAELIRRYDLLALPVIDAQTRMVGIVTVDDAMDIDKAEDATKLAKFGGTAALGGPDLDLRESSFRQLFTTRVFWLAILTVFGVITSTYVAQQEELLTEVIVLAAFVAPIIDMGGNTGSQSATLVIRAMALEQVRVTWRDIGFVIRRELPVAAMLGVSIAVLEAVLAYFSKGVGHEVLLVVGLTMMTVTVLGGVIGGLLPFMARRIGADPATLSSPMITSVMDLLGVVIYFGFAYAFLGHLLT